MRTVLLDLDGTLVDPAPGIVGCLQHALASLGHTPPAAEALTALIGPPLRQSLRAMLPDETQVEQAVEAYRARYRDWGLAQAAVYPGVPDALARLAGGARLLLCTSKATVFAREVVRTFGLAQHLDAVFGAELDGRFDDKADLIAHILETCALQPGEVCMVGDREHDIRAAHANGVLGLGVLWGYGDRQELLAAGADALCAAPAGLPAAIAALTERRPGADAPRLG